MKERGSPPKIDELAEEAARRLSSIAAGYVIRPAREDELPQVIEINMVTLPEHYPESFFRSLWEDYGKIFLVALSPEGKVVGYVMNRVEYKPGFFRHFIVRSGHVVSLAVLPEHRRRGLGFALMAIALKGMRDEYGCSESYLEVRVSNAPAISLYEKLGYSKVKIERGYYLDGEDAYIMARPLA
ncbi:MAG: N-acetyltransferase [Desulfurococcaceae archaeon]